MGVRDVRRVKKNRSERAASLPDDDCTEPAPPPARPRTAVDRLATRVSHLRRLSSVDDGNFTVTKANEAFQQVYEEGVKPQSILVRSTFIARDKKIYVAGDHDRSDRPKPPIARLIRPQGVALRLELALLFLRQCQGGSGAKIALPVSAQKSEDGALGLINLFSTGNRQRPGTNYSRPRPAMRTRQVHNALDVLAAPEFQLVTLTPTSSAGRFDTMWLNRDAPVPPAKDVSRYTLPASGAVSIPINFFTRGWIQVLSDSEIWNWLVWRHRAGMVSAEQTSAKDLQLDARNRLGIYDLTRDAWDTHQLLGKVGLLTANPGEITSTATSRGQRFTKEPHALDIDDQPLQDNAHYAVLAALSAALDERLENA